MATIYPQKTLNNQAAYARKLVRKQYRGKRVTFAPWEIRAGERGTLTLVVPFQVELSEQVQKVDSYTVAL